MDAHQEMNKKTHDEHRSIRDQTDDDNKNKGKRYNTSTMNHSLVSVSILLSIFLGQTKVSLSLASPKGRRPRPKHSRASENKKKGYLQRSSGIKTKRKKPPKWEKEGDKLFFLHEDVNEGKNGIGNASVENDLSSYSNPRELLEAKFKASVKTSVSTVQGETKQHSEPSRGNPDKKGSNPASKFMWGKIPSGPILSPRLNALFSEPTPIQTETFSMLSKKGTKNPNVVIASPTGSGKTLAYLLPLVANTKRDAFGSIMIVTPTMDLAYQIQRVVDQLWDPVRNYSGLYVVQPPKTSSLEDDDDYEPDIDQVQSWTVSEMKLCKAPIIAGTPKSLIQLLSYCRRQKEDILSDLTTVVLDEADRLLQTEHVARGNSMGEDSMAIQLLEVMQRMGVSFDVNARGGIRSSDSNQKRRFKLETSDRVRLVCASATIGRTLRRQMMDITNASSIEKSAELIVADDRTGKDETKRKSSLLPSTIDHMYSLYDDEHQLVDAIFQTMNDLPPAATLIFPGKMGVTKMVEKLQSRDLEDVNTLRDNMHFNVNDDDDDDSEILSPQAIGSWSQTPIYVVGEKFGRGLDIPNVKYVVLAAPPTSPAAYAHLAGRTGRGGNKGSAIVFVQGMKEAKRLVSLSDILGLTFSSSAGNKSIDKTIQTELSDTNIADSSEGESATVQAVQQEDIDLNDLNVVQLKEMLRRRNLKVSGRKSELIERLKENN